MTSMSFFLFQMKENEDVSLNDKSIFLKETNQFEKDLDSIILRIKVRTFYIQNIKKTTNE